MITMYTDGSFNMNRNVGGWAAITIENGIESEHSGSSEDVNSLSHVGKDGISSQRMEVIAVLEGLLTIQKPSTVEVFSDSKYVVNTVEKGWLESWMRTGKEKKHLDLWKIIYTLSKLHNLKFTWVKGHNGNHYNERCDTLALNQTQALMTLMSFNEMMSKKKVEEVNGVPAETNKVVDDIKIDIDSVFEDTVKPFDTGSNKMKDISAEPNNDNNIESPKRKNKSKGRKKKKSYFYAVAKGRKRGIFNSWNECSKSVNRYKGAIFKKFPSRSEAEEFIKDNS